MKTSPTQRSLALLRSRGYLVAVVEKWNPHIHIRQDLWGFADLLAIRDNDCLLVQTTIGANAAHRVAKIRGIPHAATWLASPNRTIVVHAWRKAGDRGKRKLWQCREIPILPA